MLQKSSFGLLEWGKNWLNVPDIIGMEGWLSG